VVLCPIVQYFLAHYLINGTIFENLYVLILPTTFACNVSHIKKNSATCYHKFISCLLHAQILNKLEFSRHNFEKYSKVKFHENPSREGPKCFLRTDRRAAMTELTVALRNFASAPKKNREMELILLDER